VAYFIKIIEEGCEWALRDYIGVLYVGSRRRLSLMKDGIVVPDVETACLEIE
jgi:hypothetical protein